MEYPGYLDGLSPEERQALEPLLKRETCPPGTVLFREGEAPATLFLLHQGTVRMVRSAEDGRELLVDLVFPGEVCGALSALDAQPSVATAVCAVEVTLSRLSRQEFLDRAGEFPGLLTRAAQVYRQKLREQVERLADLATEPSETRVARILLLLLSRLGQPVEDGLLVPDVLDTAGLAGLMGTSLETAVQVLDRFQEQGLLTRREGGLVITRVEGLQARAGLA